MKQTSSLTRKLTVAQERNAESFTNAHRTQAVVYRLYTEWFDNLPELITRYFSGFSIFHPFGYYEGKRENKVR